MVSPAVQHLTTHGARRVVIPKRHAETALQNAKEGRRGTWVSANEGLAVSQAPAPGTRQSVEVETAVTREGRVSKNARHRLGLNLA